MSLFQTRKVSRDCLTLITKTVFGGVSSIALSSRTTFHFPHELTSAHSFANRLIWNKLLRHGKTNHLLSFGLSFFFISFAYQFQFGYRLHLNKSLSKIFIFFNHSIKPVPIGSRPYIFNKSPTHFIYKPLCPLSLSLKLKNSTTLYILI